MCHFENLEVSKWNRRLWTSVTVLPTAPDWPTVPLEHVATNSLDYNDEPLLGPHQELDYDVCFVSCHNTILQGITVILSHLIICTIIINHITLSKAIKDQEADFPMEKSVWCESSGRRILTLWLQYAHRFEEICKQRQNTASRSTLNNSMNACVLQSKVDKIKIAHTHTAFWLASTPTIQPFKF